MSSEHLVGIESKKVLKKKKQLIRFVKRMQEPVE